MGNKKRTGIEGLIEEIFGEYYINNFINDTGNHHMTDDEVAYEIELLKSDNDLDIKAKIKIAIEAEEYELAADLKKILDSRK